MHEEVLCLRPVGHKTRDSSLGLLGLLRYAFRTRFNHCGVMDAINQVLTLHRTELTLNPPGNPSRDTSSLGNLKGPRMVLGI